MAELNEDSRLGIIYEIRGYDLVYIGSSIQTKSERLSTHKATYKKYVERKKGGYKCASFAILEKGDEWEMNVLEVILTDVDSTGLEKATRAWIKGTECVNKTALIDKAQARKEYKAKWAAEHIATETEEEAEARREKARAYEAEKRAKMTDEERAEKNRIRREREAEKRELLKQLKK